MKLSQTSQFKKDIRRQKRRGKDPAKLERVVRLLAGGKELPAAHRDHALMGKWIGRRDCHIEPDWVLIYRLTKDELRLERTGTHNDLF